MKPPYLLLPVVLMALAGCHRDPYAQLAIESKNNELRMLEDTLYDLQRDYELKCDEVNKLRKELGETGGGGSSILVPGTRLPGTRREPRNLFPDPPALDIDAGTPRSTPPDAATPPGNDSSTLPDEGDLDDLEPPKLDLGNDSASSSAAPSGNQVTQLYLNTACTGGRQLDQQPGDDALAVVFEPRNESGQFVATAGPVSVVLLDPETCARLGHWEFDAQQMKLALQKARPGAASNCRCPGRTSLRPRAACISMCVTGCRMEKPCRGTAR